MDIVIVTELNDISARKVLAYIKVLSDASVSLIHSNSNYEKIYCHEFLEKIPKLKSIWQRRGELPLLQVINKEAHEEINKLREFIHFSFDIHPNSIGSLFNAYNKNKLCNLFIASSVGLNVPNSKIVSNLNELKSTFLDINDAVIVKPMSDSVKFKFKNKYYSGGKTIKLQIKDISNLRDFKFPSFVQSLVKKKFEIRTFFFNDNFYSIAIFSQKFIDTSIDYRSHNSSKIRVVPFKLPENILNKIKIFVKRVELDTGSIDFIINENDEFVFLEINPSGQFDWVSLNGNFYIELDIAKYLIYAKR